MRALLISDRRVTGAFSTLRAVYRKWAWLAIASDWPSTGGVLNITAAVWTVGFHWWRSGDKKQTQNVSEYMLVLTLCLVVVVKYIYTICRHPFSSNVISCVQSLQPPSSMYCGQLLTMCDIVWHLPQGHVGCVVLC